MKTFFTAINQDSGNTSTLYIYSLHVHVTGLNAIYFSYTVMSGLFDYFRGLLVVDLLTFNFQLFQFYFICHT